MESGKGGRERGEGERKGRGNGSGRKRDIVEGGVGEKGRGRRGW
jgi:hypothetical protein